MSLKEKKIKILGILDRTNKAVKSVDSEITRIDKKRFTDLINNNAITIAELEEKVKQEIRQGRNCINRTRLRSKELLEKHEQERVKLKDEVDNGIHDDVEIQNPNCRFNKESIAEGLKLTNAKDFIICEDGSDQTLDYHLFLDLEMLKEDEIQTYEYNAFLSRKKIEICDFVKRVLEVATIELDRLCKKEEKKELNQEENSFVDVAIFLHLSKVEVTEKDKEIILYEAMKAINQDVRVIIISGPLVNGMIDFCYKSEVERSEITKDGFTKSTFFKKFAPILKSKLTHGLLNIYATKEATPGQKERFAVLISKANDETVDLKKLGLNPDYLELIQKDETSNKLAVKVEPENPKSDVWYLKKILYNPTDEQEKKNLPEKLIYITGHGSAAKNLSDIKNEKLLEAGTYMGVKSTDYADFLEHLNKIKCSFLLTSTCYAGGWNALKMHPRNANFPIAVSAVSDCCANGYLDIDFKAYYKNLKGLFDDKITFTLWPKSKKLKTALSSITGSSLKNLPLVYFLGNRYFRAVDVKNTVREVGLAEVASVQIRNKKAILFYKNVCLAPINLTCQRIIPTFVSMIPGVAHHFIKTMRANVPFNSLIKGVLGELKIVSPSMFFIGDLSCRTCNEFSALSWSRNLYIKNLFFLKRYEKKEEKEETKKILYLTGGGVLKCASYNFLSKDIWFEFKYDTDKKTLEVTPIEKRAYADALVEACGSTIATKESVFVTNNKDDEHFIEFGNAEVYYDVDRRFVRGINNCLEPEELFLHIKDHEKFRFITLEGIDFISRVKINAKGVMQKVMLNPPLSWVVPTSIKNYFFPPQKYC